VEEITLELPDAASWRSWLSENHAKDIVVWLVIYKASVKKRSLTYQEALDEALCYGWIDSRSRRVDDRKHVIRFTQRRPGGIWSVTNLNKVKALVEQGRMQPSGYAKLPTDLDEALRLANERDEQELRPPADMLLAMQDSGVMDKFENLAPSHRRAFSRWVSSTKVPATRQKRLGEVISALREDRLLEPMTKWKAK
jgi:uncharacterized protein YdeI (YjbR/CyaY-like superfamily)